MKIREKAKWQISLVLGIFFLCLILLNCKKETSNTSNLNDAKIKTSGMSGVLLFVVGDVRSGTKKLKAGDIISENESVQTGKKSTCDLQIKESEAGIVMRIKSDSVFELKTMNVNGTKIPSTIISVGNAMVNVNKKIKSGDDFNIVTPTTVAGVRGTKFEVMVNDSGSTTLSVTEGRVATRVRVSEAEDLPQEIQDKSVLIQSMKKTLESEEVIIEAGQKTNVTKEQTNRILKDTGLNDSLSNIDVSTQSNLSNKEIQDAVSIIDKNSIGADEPGKELDSSMHKNSTVKIIKTPKAELQKKLKEYEELIAVEREKLESAESTTSVLSERNKKNEEVLERRMEEITGKKMETLMLKSGKKIKGIVFSEEDTYYVITPNGQLQFKDSEVDGFDL